MARIQILELPTQVLGEAVSTPFAIVIDQVCTETTEMRGSDNSLIGKETQSELTQSDADRIAKTVGAVGAILSACTLDLA